MKRCKLDEMWVIYSPNESASYGGGGYWNNHSGWGDVENATPFTDVDPYYEMPDCVGNDARFVNYNDHKESNGGNMRVVRTAIAMAISDSMMRLNTLSYLQRSEITEATKFPLPDTNLVYLTSLINEELDDVLSKELEILNSLKKRLWSFILDARGDLAAGNKQTIDLEDMLSKHRHVDYLMRYIIAVVTDKLHVLEIAPQYAIEEPKETTARAQPVKHDRSKYREEFTTGSFEVLYDYSDVTNTHAVQIGHATLVYEDHSGRLNQESACILTARLMMAVSGKDNSIADEASELLKDIFLIHCIGLEDKEVTLLKRYFDKDSWDTI